MHCLSVVIPTYNRKDTLRKALQAYRKQSPAQQVAEVLVIDDGSTDGTGAAVLECAEESPIPIRYLSQVHKGPAAARNLGIRESPTELVLLTDDDIIPADDLVAQHMSWHRTHPAPFVAVLGYVTWSAVIGATPFMRWYSEDGPLFGFRHLAGQTEVDFARFFTCNLSLKRDYLINNGMFDEDFKSAAWEDFELGYRLHKRGMKLLFNRSAIAYHHQFFSFADARRRAQRVAEARRVLQRKEAGTYLSDLERRQRLTDPHRLPQWSTRIMERALASLEPLLDSRIPLPAAIYRKLHARCASLAESMYAPLGTIENEGE